MSKTPEQLAEEWASGRWYADHDPTVSGESKVGFLAGYKAAKDQLADADKVMNFSNNSNGWISVKDRVPEEDKKVKILINYFLGGTEVREVAKAAFRNGLWSGDKVYITHPLVSHWMPLPEPPEEEKVIKNLNQIHRPQKRISVEEAREMFPDKPPKEEK